MNETIWEFLKQRWRITKSTLKSMGIDCNKKWDEITLNELGRIAAQLDITVEELLER